MPQLGGVKREFWMDDLRWFSLSTDVSIDIHKMVEQGFLAPKPIVRRYDCREWRMNDYLAEYSYGSGKVVATTLRFCGGMGKQPLFIQNSPLAVWLIGEILRCL